MSNSILSEAIRHSGLRKRFVSDALLVNRHTLLNWERGVSRPPRIKQDSLAALLTAHGVPMTADDLFADRKKGEGQ